MQEVTYVVPAPISSLFLSRTLKKKQINYSIQNNLGLINQKNVCESTYRIIYFNVQFRPPLTTSFVRFRKFFSHPVLKVKFDIQQLLLTKKEFDCANRTYLFKGSIICWIADFAFLVESNTKRLPVSTANMSKTQ